MGSLLRRWVRKSRAHLICFAAAVLSACSGAITEYSSQVPAPAEIERPLMTARHCLEEYGYEVEFMSFELGLVWAEKTEIADADSVRFVVNEVAVMRTDEAVTIIARSKQGSGVFGKWAPVRVPASTRRDVDGLADRLGDPRVPSRGRCTPMLTHQRGRPAERSRSTRNR